MLISLESEYNPPFDLRLVPSGNSQKQSPYVHQSFRYTPAVDVAAMSPCIPCTATSALGDALAENLPQKYSTSPTVSWTPSRSRSSPSSVRRKMRNLLPLGLNLLPRCEH